MRIKGIPQLKNPALSCIIGSEIQSGEPGFDRKVAMKYLIDFFGKTVFFCFLMSFGIEILQPLINGPRSSDITDIITNVIGGMLGYGLYVIFRPVTFWILDHLKPKNLQGGQYEQD